MFFRNASIDGRKVTLSVNICLATSPEARQKYTRKRPRRSASIAMPSPRRFPRLYALVGCCMAIAGADGDGQKGVRISRE